MRPTPLPIIKVLPVFIRCHHVEESYFSCYVRSQFISITVVVYWPRLSVLSPILLKESPSLLYLLYLKIEFNCYCIA